jgi:hypothetical protein
MTIRDIIDRLRAYYYPGDDWYDAAGAKAG